MDETFRVTQTADQEGLATDDASTPEMGGDLVGMMGTVIEKQGALGRRVSALEG